MKELWALLLSEMPLLPPLTNDLVRAVVLLLPVNRRLRCSELSRAWRALLKDPSLWSRLDLSRASGFSLPLFIGFSLPLLRAALAKAGGQLCALDITGQQIDQHMPVYRFRLLFEVVTANAATLEELRMGGEYTFTVEKVRALLEAAPALQLLEADVVIRDYQLARAMLRIEPPFQALRLRRLVLRPDPRAEWTANMTVAFLLQCLDLRRHASLETLELSSFALDTAAMGVVVNACIALRLRNLVLDTCSVAPATVPDLTRLVAAGDIRELTVKDRRRDDDNTPMFDWNHESTHLLVAAARVSALTMLLLPDVAKAPEIVLQALRLINRWPDDWLEDVRRFLPFPAVAPPDLRPARPPPGSEGGEGGRARADRKGQKRRDRSRSRSEGGRSRSPRRRRSRDDRRSSHRRQHGRHRRVSSLSLAPRPSTHDAPALTPPSCTLPQVPPRAARPGGGRGGGGAREGGAA